MLEGYGPCGSCASCQPDRYIRVDGKSVLRENLPPLTKHLLQEAQRGAELELDADLPEGFELYEPHMTAMAQPLLLINKSSEACISAEAVRIYGLETVPAVQLLFNASTSQLAIKPMPAESASTLKLQRNHKSVSRYVSIRGMSRRFALQAAPGTYPLTQHPSGLLVATITQQPAHPGGEA